MARQLLCTVCGQMWACVHCIWLCLLHMHQQLHNLTTSQSPILTSSSPCPLQVAPPLEAAGHAVLCHSGVEDPPLGHPRGVPPQAQRKLAAPHGPGAPLRGYLK
jgi:hypothetical protein